MLGYHFIFFSPTWQNIPNPCSNKIQESIRQNFSFPLSFHHHNHHYHHHHHQYCLQVPEQPLSNYPENLSNKNLCCDRIPREVEFELQLAWRKLVKKGSWVQHLERGGKKAGRAGGRERTVIQADQALRGSQEALEWKWCSDFVPVWPQGDTEVSRSWLLLSPERRFCRCAFIDKAGLKWAVVGAFTL